MQLVDGTLVFLRKLKEHGGVGYLRFETLLSLDVAFEAAASLKQFLRGLLVVPEVRRGRLRLDTVQLFAAFRDIKETSRVVQLAREDRRMKLAIPEVTKSRSS